MSDECQTLLLPVVVLDGLLVPNSPSSPMKQSSPIKLVSLPLKLPSFSITGLVSFAETSFSDGIILLSLSPTL